MSESLTKKNCLNCFGQIDTQTRFCTHCGQKTKPPKLTLWEFVSDFLSNVLNLEAKIYKSLFHLFVPAKLTRAYIAGERKKYYNPIRILLIGMIVFFALLASIVNSELPNLRQFTSETEFHVNEEMILNKMDSLAPFYFEQNDLHLIDTLRHKIVGNRNSKRDSFFLHGHNIADIRFSNEKILNKDVYQLTEQEVINKYQITGRFKPTVIKQAIKIYKNPSGVPAFLIGNLLWTIIIVLFFIGFIMKILYIRGAQYFVEHLVFLTHVHSVAFILGSIFLLFILLSSNSMFLLNSNETVGAGQGIGLGKTFTIIGLGSLLFFYIAQKRYYQQGIIKTFIKFVMIIFSYVLILSMVGMMVSLLSLIFF